MHTTSNYRPNQIIQQPPSICLPILMLNVLSDVDVRPTKVIAEENVHREDEHSERWM